MNIKKIVGNMIALMTLCLGSVTFAQTQNLDVMNLPKLNQYVTDFAGVLDATTLQQFNDHAYQYDQNSGRQFVAILIPDRQGKELFDISLKAFNDNGIGSKKNNDGLLLVIATDEKKIRIMVGYGLEGQMPDVLASKIIEQDIRPLVNAGDYAGAVRVFYERVEEAIASDEAQSLAFSEDVISPELIIINLIGFIVVIGYDIWMGIMQKKRKAAEKIKGVIIGKNKNKTLYKSLPLIMVFVFQLFLILLPWRAYLIGPWLASWIGVIFYNVIAGNIVVSRGTGFGGGWSSGGSFGGGGSSFSGGGGMSGGGGAGD